VRDSERIVEDNHFGQSHAALVNEGLAAAKASWLRAWKLFEYITALAGSFFVAAF
jgi:hypothetical protein